MLGFMAFLGIVGATVTGIVSYEKKKSAKQQGFANPRYHYALQMEARNDYCTGNVIKKEARNHTRREQYEMAKRALRDKGYDWNTQWDDGYDFNDEYDYRNCDFKFYSQVMMEKNKSEVPDGTNFELQVRYLHNYCFISSRYISDGLDWCKVKRKRVIDCPHFVDKTQYELYEMVKNEYNRIYDFFETCNKYGVKKYAQVLNPYFNGDCGIDLKTKNELLSICPFMLRCVSWSILKREGVFSSDGFFHFTDKKGNPYKWNDEVVKEYMNVMSKTYIPLPSRDADDLDEVELVTMYKEVAKDTSNFFRITLEYAKQYKFRHTFVYDSIIRPTINYYNGNFYTEGFSPFEKYLNLEAAMMVDRNECQCLHYIPQKLDDITIIDFPKSEDTDVDEQEQELLDDIQE